MIGSELRRRHSETARAFLLSGIHILQESVNPVPGKEVEIVVSQRRSAIFFPKGKLANLQSDDFEKW